MDETDDLYKCLILWSRLMELYMKTNIDNGTEKH